MISRYTRRPISHNLEIRGISRSSLDHRPLPEKPGDDSILHQTTLHDPQEAIRTCNSSAASSITSPISHCPLVTTGDMTRSWSGIHSYTGTEISTEPSSVFSWGYDEFDKAASCQVQHMFEEIDEELYEGNVGVQHRTWQDECNQWASRFPHLRVLGKQLLCPTDEGFRWYATSSQSVSSANPVQGKDKTCKELCVEGYRAVLCPLSLDLPNTSDPPCYLHGDEVPKVIEAEGLVEEYLAFDCTDRDEERERECVSRQRCCLPPISPYRCWREAVLDLLFDDVWRELIGWMEELVRRFWEGCVSDEEKCAVALSPTQPHSHNPLVLLSSIPAAQLHLSLAPHRAQQFPGTLQPQSTKSRGSKHKSRRKSKKQRKPSTSSRVPVGTATTHHNLNDLITIHGIPLQQRNVGVLDRTAHEGEERMVHSPGSSITPSKLHSRRALEQSSSSMTRPSQSARRRTLPPRTLVPLASSLTQSSTAGCIDEIIRGTRLTIASDRLSPPVTLSRNTLLPPIGTGDAEQSYSGHHTRLSQCQRGPSSRAHSAVADDTGSLQPRDRLHPQDIFSRPNTTHTFWSDMPYRRSYTILDSSGQGRPSRASLGTDSLGIGVTGISLGNSSSSFLDSFSHHPLGHFLIEDEEEAAAPAPSQGLLLPQSVPVRLHSGGGQMPHSSRPGL
ncbi:protein FAM149B1 isoform X1 [Electrophorus electricus]|uniref:protein FAM149B1 isoform X1 n=1 Tax=Electrophorus electricus TaxID=8005 RepID=UPI0015D02FB1|nr:protein FAM149B1 isoform X1 [Electrophorus electricus]